MQQNIPELWVCVVESKLVGSTVYLVCNCGHFSRTGMPCRHIWHIKSKYWSNDLPSLTDVHPMWHSTYKAYAYSVGESGEKLPASSAIESYAKAFENNVIGPKLSTTAPELNEPFNPAHPRFSLLPAKDRCINWPKEMICELLTRENACDLPSMSQEVYKYSQESDDEISSSSIQWEERFRLDESAVKKRIEEDGGVAAALIPLCKELMGSAEKAKFMLPEICAQMRSIIAGLNQQDDDYQKNVPPGDSMAVPLATSRKKYKR
jgi:hypothetical protein